MQSVTRRVLGTIGLVSVAWAVSGSGCLPLPGTSGTGNVLGGATNLPPIVVLTASVVGGVAPLQVAFSSDQSTDDGLIVSREWDFGDGGTSLQVAPVHTFDTNGTFTVTLTLTDNNGATSAATQDIIVTLAPTALISVDTTVAESAPATINFSGAGSFDSDGTIKSYRWDFDDGSREDVADVSHTFTQAGTFRVRLTVTDDIGITDTAEVLIQVGTTQPAIAFRVPPEDEKSIVLSQDTPIWVQGLFAVETGVPYMIRAGLDLDTDPSNGNDIQLDTDPPNGNDLNITSGVALRLTNVASLGGKPVPAGVYRLWAEIDTDRTEPTRVYASAVYTIVEALPDTISPGVPQAALIDDTAVVLVDPDKPRQIFDLGPVAAGDQLFLGFLLPPDFAVTSEPPANVNYSLMLLDPDSNIFAWFQPGGVLFSKESRLVFAHNSAHMYIVTEGGLSLSVRIGRGANLNVTHAQRVFVNFDGTDGFHPVQIGDAPPMDVPPFNARDINSSWGASETQTIEGGVMDRLRDLYADYDVTFVTSTDLDNDPNLLIEPPYQTLDIGGADIFSPGLFGISDYIDPRNETSTGTALIFSTAIGRFVDTTATATGLAIGNVAGHELGHMLGLRHTDSPTDLMNISPDVTSPTLAFERAKVAASEQYGGLPVIGIQDAPMLLEDTVGLAP